MPRGRLIFPIRLQIFQADRAAMAADPDGAGPLKSGLDPDFQEPILESSADRTGTLRRIEKAPILIPAQVETQTYDRAQMTQTGDVKRGAMAFVLHFEDLEQLGLVSTTTGLALITTGDRVGATFDESGRLIQRFPDPPGLYVLSADPIFGLARQRNLLLINCGSRDQGGSG